MNKVKRVKNCDYTTISNVFLRDVGLSLKSKGLLAMVLSLPDDWDFSIDGMCRIVKEGKTCIYNAINELKEHGYCRVVVLRDERGVIVGNDYVFFENPNMENPNMENQPQSNKDIIKERDNKINNINNKKENSKKEKEKSEKELHSIDLFEECWIAYRRKGSKKKSLDYWEKLSDDEKRCVLSHIKSYVSTRDLQYQKDFERYLRDKIFLTIVFNGNKVVYDPTKGVDSVDSVYMPTTDGSLTWNDYYKCYMYVGWWDGVHIADGYVDDNRPDGASVTLNNGRGTIVWDAEKKEWVKK